MLYALDKDAAPPQKKRVQPPPVLAYMWMRTTTRRSSRARLLSKPTTRPHHRPGAGRRRLGGARLRRISLVPGLPARRLAHVQKMRFGSNGRHRAVRFSTVRAHRHNGRALALAARSGGRGPPLRARRNKAAPRASFTGGAIPAGASPSFSRAGRAAVVGVCSVCDGGAPRLVVFWGR